MIESLGALIRSILPDAIARWLRANDARRQYDKALFDEFLRVLPSEPTIRLLREQNFGNSFLRRSLEPLFEFSYSWENVEKEFLDGKLEKAKKALFALADDLVSEISLRTVPIRIAGYASVFSDQMRAAGTERPPSVREDARVLNIKARAFVANYEAFVRLCREKLTR